MKYRIFSSGVDLNFRTWMKYFYRPIEVQLKTLTWKRLAADVIRTSLQTQTQTQESKHFLLWELTNPTSHWDFLKKTVFKLLARSKDRASNWLEQARRSCRHRRRFYRPIYVARLISGEETENFSWH